MFNNLTRKRAALSQEAFKDLYDRTQARLDQAKATLEEVRNNLPKQTHRKEG